MSPLCAAEPAAALPRRTTSAANSRFKLAVTTLTGKVLWFHVTPKSTVAELKSKYQNREGVPPDQQRMIWEGKQLEDDRKLSEYGIGPDCKVTMVLQLRGC